MKIIVLGAGAWGSAVAMSAAQHPAGHAVTLWARDAAQAQQMRNHGQNTRYLPGIAFPPSLGIADGHFGALLPGADLVIVATPMAALRSMLQALIGCNAPVAWLCKGSKLRPRRQVQHHLGCWPTKYKHRQLPI
jgi:glycerol-3-phosphate dehydrogenase (NAD(P)+)